MMGLVVALLTAALSAEETAKKTDAVKPPWQRYLQGEDAKKAGEQEKQLAQLQEASKFSDALKTAEALAALRGKVQGKEHWQTVSARSEVEAIRRVLHQEKEEQTAYASIFALKRQAGILQSKGRYREAQPLREKVLAINRKVLGEEHCHTATSYNSLALDLNSQGKYREAEEGLLKALAIRRKVLGEEHPDTAGVYSNLALCLKAQRQYKEAEDNCRKALAIKRKVLGEKHVSTANTYDNLAACLNAQHQYKEAEDNYRKALTIRRKVLGEEHPNTARVYSNRALNLDAQLHYKEAEDNYRKALAIRRKVLGEEDLSTANTHNNLALNQKAQGKYKEAEEGFRQALTIHRKVLGEEHPNTAKVYYNLALNQTAQHKYAEAEECFRKALTNSRKVLGEEHPDTARVYSNRASNLKAQSKYKEAEDNYRKALAIARKVLGEEHRNTANSYNDLALNLNAQGKYKEAEDNLRKALALKRKVLGEEHPETIGVYNNLAVNLNDQGKYREAEEGFRKALVIRRKVLGEEHPDTAHSYGNLAENQTAQGKYAEAEKNARNALAICRKVLGEEHPDMAGSYSNLAFCLDALRRHKEAEECHRKSLAIDRKMLGEEHLSTAKGYNNLAVNQRFQGKYKEAEEGFRKALVIQRKVLGEEHQTATSYNNLAVNLDGQGKYREAEKGYRKALAIKRKVLGEEHPATVTGYNGLAYNKYAQGEYGEAERLWSQTAPSLAKNRLHIAASGLERATTTSELSTLPSLAAVLARNGKSEDAWQRFEESLGRGTWDDLTTRLRWTDAEQVKQTQLVARLDRLDKLIEKTAAVKEPTSEQIKHHEDLLTQRRQTQDELYIFAHHLEEIHGPIAGQVFSRANIQASLPSDSALIGWLDIAGQPKAADPNGEHWAVLLCSAGPPVWVRLRGNGDKEAWTDADTRLPAELRTALQSPRGSWRPLAERLREQRLQPLAKHLAGVRRLIVLPSTALAGMPIEVLAEGYTVSYAHSGTMYAYLRKQRRPETKGLFALADPVFEPPAATDRPQPLPPGGVLLTMVLPRSNAALSGLKPNDVLLRYGDTDLTHPADLKPLPETTDADKRVSVIVWRDGQTLRKQVRPGKLGAVLASEPAPRALAEQRRLDQRLASTRGGDGDKWDRLPGTRIEVASLRRLFASAPSRLLLDSESSEQRLHELAQNGELGKYRYLHLATHGEVDDRAPLRSAVILSRDQLPDPGKQLDAGLPIYDGRLTAEEVLRQWHLHSELVTLSACQTALGKYERGEGFVGFAQSLILSGSRSVCLSLWKVDDAATALLMERFYQNLLGSRAELKGPLAKAAALAEAKAWLSALSREEALKRVASLSKGVARGKRPALPPLEVPTAIVETKEARPFAHPYYWAAFVLVGHAD
jgi:tetratricopeptide (TPR) repeat protein